LRLARAIEFVAQTECLSQAPATAGSKTDDTYNTYKELSEMIEERVRRFRAAEKAVSLGLPADTFENFDVSP
jgi:hypothetical protein